VSDLFVVVIGSLARFKFKFHSNSPSQDDGRNQFRTLQLIRLINWKSAGQTGKDKLADPDDDGSSSAAKEAQNEDELE
jgi:hypothetical protein